MARRSRRLQTDPDRSSGQAATNHGSLLMTMEAGLPLGLVAVGGLAFVLWLVLLAPRLLVRSAPTDSLSDVPDPAKRHELQDNRLKLQNDARTTLLQGLGGLAVLIGVFFELPAAAAQPPTTGAQHPDNP